MPELPVVGDAPSKAAGGAGSFIQKRIGPLPLWAWVGGVAVGFLALRFVRRGGASAVSGAGVTTASAPSAFTPASASGSGSFAAPSAPPAAPVVNVIIPGYTQPNAVTGAGQNGPPEIVTTPVATAPSSHVGSTPSAVWSGVGVNNLTGAVLSGPGANAPIAGGPTKYGGPGSGPAITTITGVAGPSKPLSGRAAIAEEERLD